MAGSLIFGGSVERNEIEYLIPTPRCCHSRHAIQHTPTPKEHSYDRTGCHGNEDNSELAKDNQTPRHYPGLGFKIMTILGFSTYLMPSPWLHWQIEEGGHPGPDLSHKNWCERRRQQSVCMRLRHQGFEGCHASPLCLSRHGTRQRLGDSFLYYSVIDGRVWLGVCLRHQLMNYYNKHNIHIILT